MLTANPPRPHPDLDVQNPSIYSFGGVRIYCCIIGRDIHKIYLVLACYLCEVERELAREANPGRHLRWSLYVSRDAWKYHMKNLRCYRSWPGISVSIIFSSRITQLVVRFHDFTVEIAKCNHNFQSVNITSILIVYSRTLLVYGTPSSFVVSCQLRSWIKEI